MRLLAWCIPFFITCSYGFAAVCSPEDEASIRTFVQSYRDAWNKRSMSGIVSHYSDDYADSDLPDKLQLVDSIRKFLGLYPDATAIDTIESIEVTGDSATVKKTTVAQGHSANQSSVGKDPATMSATTQSVWHLKRVGSEWKIGSDEKISEQIVIDIGAGNELKTTVTVPDSVKAGSEFNATLDVEPTTHMLMGTINNRLAKDPPDPNKDVWRPLRNRRLSRELIANAKGEPEVVEVMIAILNSGTRDKGGGTTVGVKQIWKWVKVTK